MMNKWKIQLSLSKDLYAIQQSNEHIQQTKNLISCFKHVLAMHVYCVFVISVCCCRFYDCYSAVCQFAVCLVDSKCFSIAIEWHNRLSQTSAY